MIEYGLFDRQYLEKVRGIRWVFLKHNIPHSGYEFRLPATLIILNVNETHFGDYVCNVIDMEFEQG